MPSDYNEKMEIELVKRDVNTITRLLEKYDSALQRLQEVAMDLSRIVSVQEQRLNSQGRAQDEEENALQKFKQDTAEDLKELHEKVHKVKSDLTDKIDKTETAILGELAKLKSDTEEINKGLSNKVTAIEMWRYMVMGAIALGVFLLSKLIDIAKLFN